MRKIGISTASHRLRIKRTITKFLWAWGGVLLLGAVASPASAVSCGVGTYADYQALGAGGCTINVDLFNNFTFSSSTSGGAPPLAAKDVTVTPVAGPEFGFRFSFDLFGTFGGSGTVQHLLLGYTITVIGGAPLINDASLSQDGFTTGTGEAGVGEGLCLGSTFAGTFATGFNCPTTSIVLFTNRQTGGGLFKLTDHKVFEGVNTVDVREDIFVNAHSNLASLSFAQNTVSQAVPEPSTLLLMGAGSLGVLLLVRRAQNASRCR